MSTYIKHAHVCLYGEDYTIIDITIEGFFFKKIQTKIKSFISLFSCLNEVRGGGLAPK